MKYLILVFLLTACSTMQPKSIYAKVNGEVLRADWYQCEFGVLQYRGGNRPVLDIKGNPMSCERVVLTLDEYCAAKRPEGVYAKGCGRQVK